MADDITADRVRSAYKALATGDRNLIASFWAEEMVWQVPGHNHLSGWYHGLDEFLGFMGQVGALSGGSFVMDTISVIVEADWSADITRNRGKRADSEKKLDIEVCHVLRWADGKVIAGKGGIFGDGTTEYDQFWSRAPVVGDTQ
jgi:ketosteroid isomerase-like protein